MLAEVLGPSALTMLVQHVAGWRWLGLLPVSDAVQRDYWFVAGLLGVFLSIILVFYGDRPGGRFLCVLLVVLFVASLLPFTAARYGGTLRMDPVNFAVLSVLSYVTLIGAIGGMTGYAVGAAVRAGRSVSATRHARIG